MIDDFFIFNYMTLFSVYLIEILKKIYIILYYSYILLVHLIESRYKKTILIYSI